MSQQGQVMKFGAVILQNLPEVSGEMMQYWIENPLELQEFFVGLNKRPDSKLELWKTIKLGTGFKGADDFSKVLKDKEMKIGGWATNILGKPEFTVADEQSEVDLVKVAVAELGFKNGAKTQQIYDRAKQLGLELCSSEVGPQLRLQYEDQPNGERILIAMKPISGSDGYLSVFSVERYDSELLLSVYYGFPDYFWPPGYQWVFVCSRK